MAGKKKATAQDEQVLDVEITGTSDEAIAEEVIVTEDQTEEAEVDNAQFEGPIEEQKEEPAEAPERATEKQEESVSEDSAIRRLPRRKNNPSMFRQYLIGKKFARR